MAISTYAELKTAIANWLNRDDLTSVIPDFISLAEAQIARDLRHWRQEKRVETSFDERYENLPTDWIETINIQLADGRQLRPASLSELAYKRHAASGSGTPSLYAITSGQIELYPTPSTGVTADLTYYARTPSLTDADPTNWILTEAPDIYLYGSLVQSAPYLVDDNRIQVWAALYTSGVEKLNSENKSTRAGGPLVMRTRNQW